MGFRATKIDVYSAGMKACLTVQIHLCSRNFSSNILACDLPQSPTLPATDIDGEAGDMCLSVPPSHDLSLMPPVVHCHIVHSEDSPSRPYPARFPSPSRPTVMMPPIVLCYTIHLKHSPPRPCLAACVPPSQHLPMIPPAVHCHFCNTLEHTLSSCCDCSSFPRLLV
jgi:hypothetical protein